MKLSNEFKAGVVTVVALVGFWMLFQFFKGKDFFSSGDVYYAKYDNLSGLTISSPVLVGGYKVGSVKNIDYIQNGNTVSFLVELSVEDKVKLSKSTVASVESGLMSGSSVVLQMPDFNQVAKSGDTLVGKLKGGILDQIAGGDDLGPMKQNVGSILSRLDSTLAATNKVMNDQNTAQISQMLANLNGAIVEYKALAKNGNNLIATNSNNISKLMLSADNTMNKFSSTADKLNQMDIEKTVKSLEATLTNLNEMTTKINNGDGTMGKFINDPAMYNNLNKASANLSTLLADIKEHPKNYVHFSVFGRKDKKGGKDEEIQILDTLVVE